MSLGRRESEHLQRLTASGMLDDDDANAEGAIVGCLQCNTLPTKHGVWVDGKKIVWQKVVSRTGGTTLGRPCFHDSPPPPMCRDHTPLSPPSPIELLHQALKLKAQHVRYDWAVEQTAADQKNNTTLSPFSSGSGGGPSFLISPVIDLVGSDYVYLILTDSVRN